MIVQELTQGENKIRIETAESLEDAAKNGFPENEHSRYFINNKPVKSYMGLVQFLVSETKKTGHKIIPNHKSLMKQRDEMLQRQTDMIRQSFQEVKDKFGGSSDVDKSITAALDDMMSKIDAAGVRVHE